MIGARLSKHHIDDANVWVPMSNLLYVSLYPTLIHS